MPISLLTRSKSQFSKAFTSRRPSLLNTKGMTLIEILVSLFIVSLIYTVVSSGTFSERQSIDKVLDDIERAIRFTSDEATIRNVILRLHFDLGKDPQEFTVEYGPDANFVIPLSIRRDEKELSLREQEEFDKNTKEISKQFNTIREYSDTPDLIEYPVRLIGIGTSLQKTLVSDLESSLYIYPTGEKDSAIIILGTSEELVSLHVSPFTNRLERKYHTLKEEIPEDELFEVQLEKSREIFEKWLEE